MEPTHASSRFETRLGAKGTPQSRQEETLERLAVITMQSEPNDESVTLMRRMSDDNRTARSEEANLLGVWSCDDTKVSMR